MNYISMTGKERKIVIFALNGKKLQGFYNPNILTPIGKIQNITKVGVVLECKQITLLLNSNTK